jgi:phenylpropionate dioxygenase-like ring-hydroxylating dioxygenase large terminal subunit
MFLKNAWYVAGWSKEYGQKLVAQRLLNECVVLYRKQDGTPVALEDACPHRKLPLSKGALKDDAIECGYHGLTFDGSGKCIAAPTQPEQIPEKARVRSYPVVDRYRLLWIWMGEPELADPNDIVHIENFDNPDWGCTEGGTMEMECNYLWICDNLLDPSHVAWVHVSSFAGAGTDDGQLDLHRTDSGVTVSRWIYGQLPSPYYSDLVKFEGECDRLQHYELRIPSIAINKSVYTPVGTGGPDKPPVDKTYINVSYNFMTPVDDGLTRYFWFQHRNTDPNDESVSKFMNDGARMAFEEDRAVLTEVHKGMRDRHTPNIDLRLDAGAKLFRKQLQQRIDNENSD